MIFPENSRETVSVSTICDEYCRSYGNPACADCKGKTCAGQYMMPDELFCCDDSTRVASSPPSEVLKTLYDKDAKDLEGVAILHYCSRPGHVLLLLHVVHIWSLKS